MRNTPEKIGSAWPLQQPPKEPRGLLELQRGTGAVTHGGNPAQHRLVRDTIRDFFVSKEGSVPWQDEYAAK